MKKINFEKPDESQVPSDWPYRENSLMIRVEKILWHIQIFENDKKKQRPLFLLIHGSGGAVHSWRELVKPLSQHANLILVDLPGHGFTQEDDKTQLTLGEITRSLNQLLLTMGIKHLDVALGHSAGAAIAIELCIQTKNKVVDKLIGINPSLVPPPYAFNFFPNVLIDSVIGSKNFTSFLSLINQNTNMIENLLKSTGSELSHEQKALYKRVFSRKNHIRGSIKFMSSTDLSSLLRKTRDFGTKSTFILGEHDLWVKKIALKKILKKFFPNSQLIINSGGHLLHETNPEKISNQILEIFREH